MGDWPKTVRTTITPDQDVEVDEAAYQELKAQGLLLPGHDGTEYTGPVPSRTAPKTTTKEG